MARSDAELIAALGGAIAASAGDLGLLWVAWAADGGLGVPAPPRGVLLAGHYLGVLGIPLYGDYWSARSDPTPERARTSANSVSWSWGSGLAERNGATIKWDDVQQVPYASMEVGGTFEWLFLENARSFGAKSRCPEESTRWCIQML